MELTCTCFLGIVTRCPLVLKLRKLRHDDEWKGKVTYRDIEIDLTAASEVEQEVRKGTYTYSFILTYWGVRSNHVKCMGSACQCSHSLLSGPTWHPWELSIPLSLLLIRPQLSHILSSFPSLKSVLLNRF